MMTRFLLLIAVAFLGIGSVAASTREGAAASAICSKLHRQLASLSSNRSRSVSRAPEVRQLQGELATARAWARQENCLRGLFRRPSYSPQCMSLNNDIARLQAEIAQAKQAARYSPAGSPAERRQVLAALANYDCDATPQRSVGLFTRLFNQRQAREEASYSDTAYAPVTRQRSNAAIRLKKEREQERIRSQTRARIDRERERERDRLVERERDRNRERDRERVVERDAEPVSRRIEKIAAISESVSPLKNLNVKGGLRTLCVRTCDGYYFPISFSTDRKFFARDESSCSAMCPGTETKLYYHNVRDEDSEDMLSAATNTPYADLPTAFNYRKLKATPGCSCQAAAPQSQPVAGTNKFTPIPNGSSAMPSETREKDDAASAKTSVFIGIPRRRPDPAADPETMLNTEGGLNRDDLIRLTDKDAAMANSAGAKVRVVGPKFFPDQQEAKGLRVPGPNEAR
ncbi:DUF2865 domain-containing protein [Phyllobacterium leguminum]|uniref:Uncharacterized protein DUF2865 n=1 Tax=Phyllobacterium leguminum TaxID=314237 RepID=A0A318T8V6_9HYPH|nr:DUF2865 domain-containing protein [Phyllobacterium leguminum]PYE89975.1 uncharacterized protein DUF2865 [Phyllobacterium leguminum]